MNNNTPKGFQKSYVCSVEVDFNTSTTKGRKCKRNKPKTGILLNSKESIYSETMRLGLDPLFWKKKTER